MRILLLMWFIPLALFWGWFALSANDISFGYHIFSRTVHDLVINQYANMIGMDASLIPGTIAGACAFDTAIVLAIVGYRWRESWLPQVQQTFHSFWHGNTDDDFSSEGSVSGQVHPAE